MFFYNIAKNLTILPNGEANYILNKRHCGNETTVHKTVCLIVNIHSKSIVYSSLSGLVNTIIPSSSLIYPIIYISPPIS